MTAGGRESISRPGNEEGSGVSEAIGADLVADGGGDGAGTVGDEMTDGVGD